jgi:glycosyltransferase involved in cell wall biosynthesis
LTYHLPHVQQKQEKVMSATVSIGLPVRNGAQYLMRALDSILSQTFDDFEIIVSDNASTDDTQRICCDYARRDARIRYKRQSKNIGLSANFNYVFEQSKGLYFKWAAHDDELDSRYLELCVWSLERSPDAVLCHSLLQYIDENGAGIGVYDSALAGTGSEDPVKRFASCVLFPHPGYEVMGMFRREALVGSLLIGPFHSCDRALVAELALRGRFLKIDRPLLLVRDHPERYSRKMFRPKDRLAYHSPRDATRFTMPNWRLYGEYLKMVPKNLSDTRQRWRCYAALLRWWCYNWNAVRLAIDPVAIAFPNVVKTAEQLKQKWISPAPGAGQARRKSRFDNDYL